MLHRRPADPFPAVLGGVKLTPVRPEGPPMKLLLADDDADFRLSLQLTLPTWGYECVEAADGVTALTVLQGPDSPPLALLDWAMPGLDGPEVCRRVRDSSRAVPPVLILITGRSDHDAVLAGLRAGANDYIIKPFDPDELEARLNVGRQVVGLHQRLAARVQELEEALGRVKQLQGLLPICAWCKKVRDDQNYWEQVEDYMTKHLDIHFSHGVCPDCYKKELDAALTPT